MTEYDHHSNVSFKIVDAWIEPEQVEETVFADRIVLQVEDFKADQITIRPKYKTTEERKQDGMKVKDTVKKRYAIPQLPEDLKQLIQDAQDSKITAQADIGEMIPENGNESSFFIRYDMVDTLERVETDTILDPEGEEATEVRNP